MGRCAHLSNCLQEKKKYPEKHKQTICFLIRLIQL